jgi:hypothetical protein
VDFSFTEEQNKFRLEVCNFLEEEIEKGCWKPTCDAWIQGFDTEFTKRVAQRGWIGLTWLVWIRGFEEGIFTPHC